MIFGIIAYFIVVFIVIYVLDFKSESFNQLPTMIVIKNGVGFYSNKRHRIKIDGCRYEQMGNYVFVFSKDGRIIEIKNIDNIFKRDKYLYFNAMGRVEICAKISNEYEYFYLNILSEKFDIQQVKQNALKELVNNFFDLNLSKNAKKYLNILKNVLKITIFEKKLTIKQNIFKFPFKVEYIINGKMKKVKLNY